MALHCYVNAIPDSITCSTLKLFPLLEVLPLIPRNKLKIFKQKGNINFFSLTFSWYAIQMLACLFTFGCSSEDDNTIFMSKMSPLHSLTLSNVSAKYQL